MSVNKAYFVDIFDEMIQNIQTIYDTVNTPVETPYGMYGHRQEICELLIEKTESAIWKFKKYPLIILYHSQIENRGSEVNTEFEVDALISIITDSSRNFKTSDRFTNSVKPILMPLYELLLDEIANHPAFYQSYRHEIKHKLKIWDGNPSDNKEIGTMFNDDLDGIDISFSGLKIFKEIPTSTTMSF